MCGAGATVRDTLCESCASRYVHWQCAECGTPSLRLREVADERLCTDCAVRILWDRVPADVRDEIDELIAEGKHILAIMAFRDRSGIEPKPGIREGVHLLDLRGKVVKRRAPQ
ncbi:hypothetical protein GCM10023192_37680 [Amycolatopsis samaneae]